VYGGWEGHEPAKNKDFWVPRLEAEGFEVVVSANHEPYADATLMAGIDLIVQSWTMGTIERAPLAGLLGAVKNGAGFAGWHGGTADAFRNESEFHFMVGGQWVAHPGGQVDYKVTIVDGEDDVTKGLRDFSIKTEQYYMLVDPNNKVLATTLFSGEHDASIKGATMPVVWKRQYGKGRVFYSALGHTPALFDVREVFEITRRGLLWAGESKYSGTPSLVRPIYTAS
jgi:type 1 glutamine amidotransferase